METYWVNNLKAANYTRAYNKSAPGRGIRADGTDPWKSRIPLGAIYRHQFGSNIAYTWLVEGGDVEQAFKDADVVVKQRMTNQRLIPNPMETRGVVARQPDGLLSISRASPRT